MDNEQLGKERLCTFLLRLVCLTIGIAECIKLLHGISNTLSHRRPLEHLASFPDIGYVMPFQQYGQVI